MLEYGKAQREEGKPVADLCKMLSLPRSTLYRWETGPEEKQATGPKETPAALVWALRYDQSWKGPDVARFTQGIFARYGIPCVFKHDLGPEFRSGVFQALLRAHKILPLPNPLWWRTTTI